MPIYIGELSLKKKTGFMISMVGPGAAIGLLIGLMRNVGFERFDAGWRVTYGVQALGGLLYAIGFL